MDLRLIEFIETLQLFGVSHIFLYVNKMQDKDFEILKYYQTRGIISVMPIAWPGDQPLLDALIHTRYHNIKKMNSLAGFTNIHCLQMARNK